MTIRNPNHPQKGSRTLVWPIRKKSDILRIKGYLKHKPRDYLLFTLGINTGYRANELLSLKVRQLKYLDVGDELEIFQTKTKKYRRTTINKTVYNAVQKWLLIADLKDDDPIFASQKRVNGKYVALKVPVLNAMVKKWCADHRIEGNYGTHTLRKTWGYHQRKYNGVPLHLLQFAFDHASPKQTLDYLCIVDDEVRELFNFSI